MAERIIITDNQGINADQNFTAFFNAAHAGQANTQTMNLVYSGWKAQQQKFTAQLENLFLALPENHTVKLSVADQTGITLSLVCGDKEIQKLGIDDVIDSLDQLIEQLKSK